MQTCCDLLDKGRSTKSHVPLRGARTSAEPLHELVRAGSATTIPPMHDAISSDKAEMR